MWKWKQLTGSPSLVEIAIAELWAGLFVYLSRNSGGVAFTMMAFGFANFGWAALMRGFHWRNYDSDPAPLPAGLVILCVIGACWRAGSFYFGRSSPPP